MEIGLVILAIMLATLLGWLLKQSFNTQPWVAEAVEESAYQAPFNERPKLVALTTFLAVATSFFALILSAYALRMELGQQPGVGFVPQQHLSHQQQLCLFHGQNEVCASHQISICLAGTVGSDINTLPGQCLDSMWLGLVAVQRVGAGRTDRDISRKLRWQKVPQ